MARTKAFRDAEGAVTPVLGTALMVGIVVMLSAGVVLIVNKVQDDRDDKPKHETFFIKDEEADRIQMARGEMEMNWDELTIKAAPSVRYEMNGESDILSTILTTAYASPGSGPATGGDFLDFCGPLGEVRDVRITITHEVANKVLYDSEFSVVAPCA